MGNVVNEKHVKPLTAAVAPVVAELRPIELGGGDGCFIFKTAKILSVLLLPSLLYVGRCVAFIVEYFQDILMVCGGR